MGKHLILISHGLFCQELKKSSEMIMGEQEAIRTVALLPSDGPDDFLKKFEETTKDLDDFIVLADLMGGTPCNVVSRLLMEGQTFDLYAGMNMPMVIGFLNGLLLDQDVDLIKYGTSNISHVNALIRSGADDDDET